MGGVNSVYCIVINPRTAQSGTVEQYVKRIRESEGKDCQYFLIFTHADVATNMLLGDEVMRGAIGHRVFTVSNLTNQGIDELRQEILRHLHEQRSRFEVVVTPQTSAVSRLLESNRPVASFQRLCREAEASSRGQLSKAMIVNTLYLLQRTFCVCEREREKNHLIVTNTNDRGRD